MTGSGDDARATQRLKLFQPGEFALADRTERLHLLDLSVRGARAYAANPPFPGDWVRIDCVVPLGRAQVMWVRDRTFGLSFGLTLSDDTVRHVAKADQRFRDILRGRPPII